MRDDAGRPDRHRLKLDSLLPDVFSPRASCADAMVDLLGVPYDFWSLLLFLVVAAAGVLVIRERR